MGRRKKVQFDWAEMEALDAEYQMLCEWWAKHQEQLKQAKEQKQQKLQKLEQQKGKI